MQPINYSIDVQTPFQAAAQGYGLGAGIQQHQSQLEEQEHARLAAEQQQADVAALIGNPNASGRDYAALTLKYPKLREQFKQAWETVSGDHRSANLDLTTRAYAALTSGKPEIAEKLMRERAQAMRNSGLPEQEVAAQEMWADLIKESPEQARHIGGLLLSSVMEPDKFAETFAKLGDQGRAADKAPSELAKSQADAETAKVKAKYANSEALLDLEKKGWDIKKVAADIDIAREGNRIAAMNAAAAREGNQLKREELQLRVQDARAALDTKIREKAAEADSAVGGIADTLNILRDIKADPDNLAAATGTLAFRAAVPGSEARSMAGKIEQLQNALAATNLDKLKGAMSDKDILFLKNIASNLDRYQDEDKFVDELGRIEGALTRADAAARKKYGLPPALRPIPPKPKDDAGAKPAPAGGAGAPTVTNW